MLSSAARSKYVCFACRTRILRRFPTGARLLPSACTVLRSFSSGVDPTYPTAPAKRGRGRPPKTHRDDGRPSFAGKPSAASYDDLNIPFEVEESESGVTSTKELSDILSTVAERRRPKSQYPPQAPESSVLSNPGNALVRWNGLGMRDVVVTTMLSAFPEITRPTYTQVRLLPPLARGNSVVVNDQPGSGKSFCIAVWLLSLDRAIRGYVNGRPNISTTALVLVPNIDLALQYRSTMLNLLEHTGSDIIKSNPHGFVQALYRSKEHEGEMLQILKDNPRPHIVIATPTILLDILSSKDPVIRDLIDYHSLKAIVMDEVDSAVSRYDDDAESAPEHQKSSSEVRPGDKDKRDPAMILLDWVFKARKAHAIKAGKKPVQPQVVISSSSMGRARIIKTLTEHHPSWFDNDKRPGGFTMVNPPPASQIVLVNSRSRDPVDKGKVIPLVPDTIQHCVVAYDMETGEIRDAPLPHHSDGLAGIQNYKSREAEIIANFERALATKDDDAVARLLEQFQHASAINTRTGYPNGVAVDILEKLLEHDGHPANVMVALGEAVSQKAFIEECTKRGITARQLQFDTWNEHAPVPLGRTDQLTGTTWRPEKTSKESPTNVWVTNYFACRGLDTPGLTHAYILHRINKNREYVTYCGRVARWPYTSATEQLRDPKSLGRDIRPRGKVVTVVLEGEEPLEGVSMVKKGSDAGSQWAWEIEAVRLLKTGVERSSYFAGSKDEANAQGDVATNYVPFGRQEVGESQ